MRIKLQLVICHDEGQEETIMDVIALNKHQQRIEHLGLTLAESKHLLSTLQRHLVWCKKSVVYTQLKLCLLGSQLTDPQSPLLGCVSYDRDSLARSRMSLRVSALRWKPNACN